MKKGNWKQEVARDVLALGSLPFYLIVLARSTIGQYPQFISQLAFAMIVLLAGYWLFKEANQHIARSLVILIFTTLFYQEIGFATAAIVLWFGIVYSAYHLKVPKKQLVYGFILGVLAVAAGHYTTVAVIG